jgi:uncharacterized membrane protein YgdD (TMEM256/DUF423 family)
MQPRTWIAVAALLAAAGVACGAFGAHALEARLDADALANWRTAVRYQVWHALALFLFALLRERHPGSNLPGWCFLVGAVLFSGSIYLLSLDVGASFVWPLTPLGGSFLIVGWVALAVQQLRAAR